MIQEDGESFLVTNGHIIFKMARSEEIVGKWAQFEFTDKIKPLWDRVMSAPNAVGVFGGLSRTGDHFYRTIGENGLINEAFVRCFPECDFAVTDAKDNPVVVIKDGHTIAVIAQVRKNRIEKFDGEASDELVFRAFACKENGYYAQGAGYYESQISELNTSLDEWEGKMEEAESECEALRDQITECRAAIDKLKVIA